MFEGILCQVTEYDPAVLECLSQGDCPWELRPVHSDLIHPWRSSRAIKDLGFHRDLLFRTLTLPAERFPYPRKPTSHLFGTRNAVFLLMTHWRCNTEITSLDREADRWCGPLNVRELGLWHLSDSAGPKQLPN
jgi:hypothetical protein